MAIAAVTQRRTISFIHFIALNAGAFVPILDGCDGREVPSAPDFEGDYLWAMRETWPSGPFFLC